MVHLKKLRLIEIQPESTVIVAGEAEINLSKESPVGPQD